jgi:hypothetical protein
MLFHYVGTCVTSKGDALPGWYVEVINLADSSVAPIYSDESSTAIVAVSGVANRALVDREGNFDFFVEYGTYSLRFYDTVGTLKKTQRYISMYGGVDPDAFDQAVTDLNAEIEANLTIVTDAVDTVDTVNNAIAAFTFPIGIYVAKSAGIDDGIYYAEFSSPYALIASRFVGKVVSGTGIISATVQVNDAPVYGPVTLSTTEFEDLSPGVTIAIGDDVNVLIESITGTVTGFYAKVEGVPA